MSGLIERLFSKTAYKLVFFTIIGLLIFLFSNSNGLFWDNVLFGSRMGNQLYQNSIFNWYMPDSFDPGHPPFLGFLLAIAWKVLGHKLWVSHLVMLPFSIGLLYQLHKFASFYLKNNKLQFFAFLLLLVDPSLSAQFVLVNPEIITLFFFFLAINGILYDSTYLKIIGLFFLSIVSFRSMMLAAGVFTFDLLNQLLLEKKRFRTILSIKFVTTYLIGSIPGITYVVWRLMTKGWLQTHPESPWAELWHFVDLEMFLRNCVVLGHRYADFGRIFILLFLLISFLKFRKVIFTKEIKQLMLLAIASVIFIVVTSLLATNTMGHRYFIVSYLALGLLAFVIISKHYSFKKIIYIVLIGGLVAGNLWIYPRDIAQGWDASLAHVPYHSLRIKALEYLDENDIKIEETASFFPNTSRIDDVDLSGDLRQFEAYNGHNKYFFYSNVYNLNDATYENLDNNYDIIKKFEKCRIHIYIYKFKNTNLIP